MSRTKKLANDRPAKVVCIATHPRFYAPKTHLSSLIRSTRQAHSLSESEVAHSCGISLRTLLEMERGNQIPEDELMGQLCVKLGISIRAVAQAEKMDRQAAATRRSYS
jgi:transcriptional regulator with XRE-family HTH domain